MSNTTDDDLMLDQKRKSSLIKAVAVYPQQAQTGHFDFADLETRLDLLEAYWRDFNANDMILQRKSDALQNRTYFKNDLFTATINEYINTKTWFKRQMALLVNPVPLPQAANVNRENQTVNNQSALERLKPPTFDGKQSEWEAFKDKFTSLVINESWTPIVKFNHLQNSLIGPAAKSLTGIRASG